jgi:hypothetical protein
VRRRRAGGGGTAPPNKANVHVPRLQHVAARFGDSGEVDPDSVPPVEAAFQAMAKAQDDGLIKNIGVSNFGVEQVLWAGHSLWFACSDHDFFRGTNRCLCPAAQGGDGGAAGGPQDRLQPAVLQPVSKTGSTRSTDKLNRSTLN